MTNQLSPFRLSTPRHPVVCLRGARPDVRSAIAGFLHQVGLLVVLTPDAGQIPTVTIEVALDHAATPAQSGAVVARHFGITVHQAGTQLVLTDGESAVRIWPERRTMTVSCYPEVVEAQPWDRRNLIILYGLSTLFRFLGFFALHGGAVVKDGAAALLVGESGSGKSTLACCLARAGWEYLADDSLLLGRDGDGGVVAWSLRRSLVLKRDPLLQGVAVPHRRLEVAGHDRFLIEPEDLGASRVVGPASPRLLLFPVVEASARTTVVGRDRPAALYDLLCASSITDLEPSQTQAHVAVLTDLIRQCRLADLRAGRDVLEDPAAVSRLVAEYLAGSETRGVGAV